MAEQLVKMPGSTVTVTVSYSYQGPGGAYRFGAALSPVSGTPTPPTTPAAVVDGSLGVALSPLNGQVTIKIGVPGNIPAGYYAVYFSISNLVNGQVSGSELIVANLTATYGAPVIAVPLQSPVFGGFSASVS